MEADQGSVTIDISHFSRLTRQELEALCAKYAQMISAHETRMVEVNDLLCTNLKELRQLKDINKKLANDNKQLQDLCCYLDNDRLEGRKLAKEWQKFGKYSANVVKKEVPVYKSKLEVLEKMQNELVDTLENCLTLFEDQFYDAENGSAIRETPESYFQSDVLDPSGKAGAIQESDRDNTNDSSILTSSESEQNQFTIFARTSSVQKFRSPRRRHQPSKTFIVERIEPPADFRENQLSSVKMPSSGSTNSQSVALSNSNQPSIESSGTEPRFARAFYVDTSPTHNRSETVLRESINSQSTSAEGQRDDESGVISNSSDESVENLSGRDSASIISSVCLSTI